MIDSLITNRRIEGFTIFENRYCRLAIDGGFVVGCDSLLRYIGEDGTFITNEDHGQWFGLSAPVNAEKEIGERINGKTIQSVKIRSETGDLAIQVDGGRMEILASSRGFENYTLNGPSGFICTGYGGSQLDS